MKLFALEKIIISDSYKKIILSSDKTEIIRPILRGREIYKYKGDLFVHDVVENVVGV